MPNDFALGAKLPTGQSEKSVKDSDELSEALIRRETEKRLLREAAWSRPAGQPAHSGAEGKSYLETGIDSVTSLLVKNPDSRKELNHYAAEFVKTASLFTGGKLGFAGAAIAYGLDQSSPEDNWKTQAQDFALGAGKGSALKGSFGLLGASGACAPLKGAMMGLASGTADEVFKRETLNDPTGLNYRLRENVYNPQALLMNAAVFTLGEGLYSGINLASKGSLAANRKLSGMVMGGSFGFVNDTVAEASKEMHENGRINPGTVMWKGLLGASFSAAGARTGIEVSSPAFQAQVKRGALSTLDWAGLNPVPRSREFILTGGAAELQKFKNEESQSAITSVKEIRNILGWQRIGPEKQLLLQHSEEKTSRIPIPRLADLIASCNPENLSKMERAAHLFPSGRGPVYLEEGSANRIRLSVGTEPLQWKNAIGSNRIMLGGRESKINAMAPLLIGDPNDLEGAASKDAWNNFSSQLTQAKKIGIDGISTDVWWGIAEPKEGNFQWKYYDKLSSKIIGAGLKWVPIQSFHECGGNIGDSNNIPVPFWVWNKISSQIPGSSPDVGKFKSEQGNVSSEYPQFWADQYATPLYKNFMTAFSEHFSGKAQNISEINISLGPAGEARYPSYNSHDKGTGYPERGAMQAHSDLAREDFKDWAIKKYGSFEALNTAWGGNVINVEPPVNVEAFYRDKRHINTQYGRDVMDWYNDSIIKHIQTVMTTAFDVYGPNSDFKTSRIGMKIPGVHWRIGVNTGNGVILSDRLAELNAGMIRTSGNDWESDDLGRGYRPLLSGIKKLMSLPGGNRLTLHFTALEMADGRDSEMNAKALPYTLAGWVGKEARLQGIPIKGENALASTLSNPSAWSIMASHLGSITPGAEFEGLTILRLNDAVGSSPAKESLEQLIKSIRGKQPRSAKNAG